METILLYYIKVNLALAFLYVMYRLLFQHDTFFQLRRYTLLAIYLIAFIYPLPDISNWMSAQPELREVVRSYSEMFSAEQIPQLTVVADVQPETNPLNLASIILWGIYGIGAFVLLFRCFIELTTVVYTRYKSNKVEIENTPVCVLSKPEEPYSFFKWIFIYPWELSRQTLHEVLIHERTHVLQHHSVDVMIGQIISVFCWINPFAWLLKQEISINQEYIADREVMRAGFDKKEYQYHLIGMEHSPMAAANLYNYFSVLPLKKRISMLNKKRTSRARTIKYLALIPLAVTLLIINNIDTMARVWTGSVSEIINEVVAQPEVKTVLPFIQQDNSKVYKASEIDKKPQFADEERGYFKFINSSIKYPVIAMENDIQGVIKASYIIEKDGSVSNIKITKGVDPSLDKEVIRVLESMSKWTPGEHQGKPVRVEETISFSFRLQGGDNDDKVKNTESADVVIVAFARPKAAKPKMQIVDDTDHVYTVVESMPQFPGGDKALIEFVNKNIIYPEEPFKNGIQGRVVVSFVVNTDGSVADAKIVRSVDSSLDKEAIRVVNSMPAWTPGKHKGKTVRVQYTLPIQFRITNNTAN